MTWRHLTRRKKCDDFWLPSTESFPTIYNMNDLAAIIFSRYYTLSVSHSYHLGLLSPIIFWLFTVCVYSSMVTAICYMFLFLFWDMHYRVTVSLLLPVETFSGCRVMMRRKTVYQIRCGAADIKLVIWMETYVWVVIEEWEGRSCLGIISWRTSASFARKWGFLTRLLLPMKTRIKSIKWPALSITSWKKRWSISIQVFILSQWFPRRPLGDT